MPSRARQRATSIPTRRGAGRRVIGEGIRTRRGDRADAAARTASPFSCGRAAQVVLERRHPLAQAGVGRGEDADGEQARRCGRRRSATVATGTPAGICTIESSESMPVEVLQRHGHADDRQRRDRGEHAGQVGGSSGARR